MPDKPRLLPPNATGLELALEQAASRVGDIALPINTLWSAETCPVELLPWLAFALGVETWRADWSETTKRAVIAATPLIKRRKGTVAAVTAAVAAYGGALSLREWWQTTPPGPPHTFNVTLTVADADDDALSAQFVADVIAAINAAKPERSHFTFEQGLQAAASLNVRGAGRAAVYVRLQLPVLEPA